jgi:hypothetical protein
VPEDDLAHFVIEAVERVSISSFKVNHHGAGKAQYHPRMMLALLIYCHANGIFSSRRIERATHRDVAVRCIAAALGHLIKARWRRGGRYDNAGACRPAGGTRREGLSRYRHRW